MLYLVVVEKESVCRGHVLVEASNAEEAQDWAMEHLLDNSDDIEWDDEQSMCYRVEDEPALQKDKEHGN